MYPNVHCSIFTKAGTWKQPKCPLTDEWIKKLWYMYTIDCDSAMEMNASESVLIRQMNLEPIVQSEVRKRNRMLMHIYGIQKNSTEKPTYREEMETQTQKTDQWTQWEKERAGQIEKVTLHVYILMCKI